MTHSPEADEHASAGHAAGHRATHPETRGHFPAGDPGRQLQTLPFARAMGIAWQGWRGDAVSMRLPFSTAVCEDDGTRISSLAVLALLDQTCSAAGFAALPSARLIATTDLRVDFAAQPEAGADVECDAVVDWQDSDWAFTRARACCARTGKLLAFARSTYALGAHPGTGPRTALSESALAEWREAGVRGLGRRSFRELLGLRTDAHGATMPFDASLVGATSLPALHGGAVAGALAGAALQHLADREPDTAYRLLCCSIQYLRAARAADVQVEVATVKRGNRSVIVDAFARQAERDVARASCVLVDARSAHHPPVSGPAS